MTNFGMGNGNNSVKANSKLAWRTSVLLAVVIGAVCMAPTVATAEVIQIQVGGVDFGYDGTNITDMDVSDPDTLTNATFLVDNALVGVDVTGVTGLHPGI